MRPHRGSVHGAPPTDGHRVLLRARRADAHKGATISPGPIYDTIPGERMGHRIAPMFSMSPKWADQTSPRMAPYQAPLGHLPFALGHQVEGKRTSAPNYQFGTSPQRPKGTVGSQYFGKEHEFATRGKASLHVPNYLEHRMNGLFRSHKEANSPHFGFSKEPRF